MTTNYNEIEELIVKRITGEISFLEDKWLDSWLEEDPQNRELFDRIISDKEGNIKKQILNDYHSAFNKFKIIKAEKQRRKRLILIAKISGCAAILIVSFLITTLLLKTPDKQHEPLLAAQTITRNNPILKLSNGDVVSFENIEKVKEKNDTSAMIVIQNNALVYTAQNRVEEDKVIFNELIVPNKCRYMVELSDSTKVWVNANSSIRFPVAFGKKERRVSITGEVLFEVAKDTERPFIVEVNELIVKVLGTQFNINSYDNLDDIKVTLVEGSVESYTNEWRKVMKPNEQLSYNKVAKNFTVKEVNGSEFTLWKDGTYIFKCENLRVITGIISRWYGIECRVINPDYDNIEITGVLDVNMGLEQFMKLLKTTSKIRYKIENEDLIIF